MTAKRVLIVEDDEYLRRVEHNRKLAAGELPPSRPYNLPEVALEPPTAEVPA